MGAPQAAYRHAVLLALLGAIGIADFGAGTASARDVQAEQGRQSSALPPIVQRILAEALLREKAEQASNSDSPWRISFPLPVCSFDRGLCGAVNRDGSIAVPPRYDFVDRFHEGRAAVRSAGRYGYVDMKGNVIVEPQYAVAGPYLLGVAEVDIEGKSALIGLDGRIVLEPRFAAAIPFTGDVFWVNNGVREYRGPPGNEEFAGLRLTGGVGHMIWTKGKWGLVDRAGAWVHEPEFSSLAEFEPGSRELMWARHDKGWGLIRPDGTWFVEPRFEYAGKLVDERAAIRLGNRTGYVDRTGQVVIAPKFDGLNAFGDFVDGMPSPAQSGSLTGLISRSGEWVLEPVYDSILHFNRDIQEPTPLFKGFLARRAGKNDLLDRFGSKFITGLSIDYVFVNIYTTNRSEVAPFPISCADGRIIGVVDKKPRMFARDGAPLTPSQGELWWPLSCEAPYAVKVGGKFGYVDDALRPLTEAKFEQVSLFRNGLASVKLDGKYGLIRRDGTWALDAAFDAAQSLDDEVALVQAGRDASILNIVTGVLTTPTQFDDACPLGLGVVGVVVGGKMGAVDRDGRWLTGPNYEPFRFRYNQGFAPVRADGKWGFLDWAGNTIEAKFDEARPFERGVAWVKNSETWCPIDRRGERVPSLACQSADPNPHQAPHRDQLLPCKIPR